MLQSFYTGNTGLGANKQWLSVISDNIANVNTVGFKSERVNFDDLVSSSLTTYSSSGAPQNKEIGGGVYVGNTIKDFSQGAFKNTNQPLSLALDGEGFFMVKNPSVDLTYYTRNGDFRLDANGDVILSNGYKLQGWKLDENGNMAGAIDKINVPSSLEPKTTQNVKFEEPTNLDSRTASIPANAFNPNNSSTYNYVNTITVYDSLGNPHTEYIYFVHTSKQENKWEAHFFLDDTTASMSHSPVTLQFDSLGALTKVKDSPTSIATVSVSLSNGASTPLQIVMNFKNMRQVASDFIFYAQQDGSSKGDLMNISVTEDGVIRGSYTNGQIKDIARLAVATFKDKEILVRKGDNLYLPNQQTFTPIIIPGGVINKVRSGMLEMSNVDISKEFINLITAQRAYQANAKTISTSDQILQTTMNLKR